MPSGIFLSGFGRATARLRTMQQAARRNADDEASVVADADHALAVEYGTRHRRATPFFRLGLRKVQTGDLGTPIGLFDMAFGDGGSVPDAIADRAERMIEAEIEARGLVVTGTLLRSVHTEG